MNTPNPEPESKLADSLLKAGIATAAAGTLAQAAQGADDAVAPPPTTLVQLYLRGGADALTMCVPTNEPNYSASRNKTEVLAPNTPNSHANQWWTQIVPPVMSGGTVQRTGFGLPHAMMPLMPLWNSGDLTFVHGAGSTVSDRSHFTQQANTERAGNQSDGWLGRYLSVVPARGNGLRALGINNTLITSFSGGTRVTPTDEPDNFNFPGGATVRTNLLNLFGSSPNAVLPSIQNDDKAVTDLSSVTWGLAGSTYRPTQLGKQFEQAYKVIRDLPDIEVISIDYDNVAGERWDTHVNQGCFQLPNALNPNVFDNGAMFNLMDNLSDTLATFMKDVGALTNRRVLVYVYSEFGRTLVENISEGTDHGRGGIAMLLGSQVTSSQVFTHPTNWQGLATGGLDGGDQAVTVDLRTLQAEVLEKGMGLSLAQLDLIFPNRSSFYPDASGPFNLVS